MWEIIYINESGNKCIAKIKDNKYFYWSHKRNPLTGKHYKVWRSYVDKFLNKCKKCIVLSILEVKNA